MESGYAEDAGRKEPKFGTMQDGDGYDTCAVCGSYPVVNVRGEYDGHETFIAECPKCGNRAEYGFVRLLPYDSYYISRLMSNWNDKQKEIAEKEMRHIEEANRKDGMQPSSVESQTAGNVSQTKIADMCDRLKNLLLEKNRKYGDSALNPCRVFSKSDAVEQLKVRMDDKLSRIRNAQSDEDEDVYMDLAGYLVLMMVAREIKKEKGEVQA